MVKQYKADLDFPTPGEEDEDFPTPPTVKTQSVSQQTSRAFNVPRGASGSTFEMEGFTDPTAAAPPVEQQDTLPPKKVDPVKFEELSTPENLQTIKDYATTRFGKAGQQKKGESDEAYIKRWMTNMRQIEWNTAFNGVPELNWIYNAKNEDVLKAAKAHELYERVPDWYEEGGQPGIRPFAEATLSAVSDPSNLLGLGVGTAVKYRAARMGIKNAISTRIKAATVGATVEGTVGAGAAAVDQQRKLKLDKTLVKDDIDKQRQNVEDALDFGVIDEDRYKVIMGSIDEREKENEERSLSLKDVALEAAISAVLGGFEAGAAVGKVKKTTKEDLAEILATRSKTPVDKELKKLTEAFDSQLEDTLTEFDIFEGRKKLDEISPQSPLTNAEIKKDISIRAINVAKYVLLNDPSFSEVVKRVAAKEQKVSNAVRDVFMSVDTIDEDILDAALVKSGLTLKEFGQTMRTTVADAASVMNGYSYLAKIIDKAVKLDPEAEEILSKLYGKDKKDSSFFGTLINFTRRAERETKALVVASIDTTVRNVYGTTTGMTMDAASRALDGTVYAFGGAFDAFRRQGIKAGAQELGDGLNKMVRDSFNGLTYLTNAGLTAEITDKLLASNPKLNRMLFNTLQETGDQKLTRLSRMANTFNAAQDAFFRRAIFTASVERQLRSVGMDMYQIMADGKNVPADVLKRAADDALKGTFSYMPKAQPGGGQTAEAIAEDLANKTVRLLEKVPGGSLAVTFPRFMSNAMAFQYKYSMFGGMSGAMDLMAAARKADPVEAQRLRMQGREKIARGTVGTGMLLAAAAYRVDNQDSKWNEIQNEDKSTADITAIFPFGPYFAVGDILAKIYLGKATDADILGAIEAVAGMKMPAGTQASILNELPEIFANEEGKISERFQKAMGKVLGDFASRAIQPAKPAFTFFELFMEESQVARDPNVLTSDNLLTEAAINRVRVKVPGLKEGLPPALQYLRPGQEERVRAGEFFNVLTGVRVVPSANKIEQEFKKLNLEAFNYYGTSGDKVYDRALIMNSAPYIERLVGGVIKSDRYEKMDSVQRKIAIKNNMQYALGAGRDLTMAKLSNSDRDRIDKMAFNKLTSLERKAVNELYAVNNEGRTLDEDKAYDQAVKYLPLLERYR